TDSLGPPLLSWAYCRSMIAPAVPSRGRRCPVETTEEPSGSGPRALSPGAAGRGVGAGRSPAPTTRGGGGAGAPDPGGTTPVGSDASAVDRQGKAVVAGTDLGANQARAGRRTPVGDVAEVGRRDNRPAGLVEAGQRHRDALMVGPELERGQPAAGRAARDGRR